MFCAILYSAFVCRDLVITVSFLSLKFANTVVQFKIWSFLANLFFCFTRTRETNSEEVAAL